MEVETEHVFTMLNESIEQDINIKLSQVRDVLRFLMVQVMDPEYGMYLWPSAIVLGDFICSYVSLFSGKRVLELGTGTGVCGIIASAVGSDVILTDLADSEEIAENCGRTIQNNKAILRSIPRYLGFTWAQFNKQIIDLANTCPPEIIIGADVLYDEAGIATLM